ncbi:MAG: hypothetical protein GXP62_13560 [Oligoflexia bacterium]|nr:hypothetical protein [Oligoflexia bacterium]
MLAVLMLILACSSGDPAISQARTALQAALASGDVTAVSNAARAAGDLEGKDPALDRLLGDALANHLLRTEDGARLLRANPAPGDPVWLDAATDAALRIGDRPWLAKLLALRGVELDLKRSVVDQVMRLSASDASIDHKVLETVVEDCALVGSRTRTGRRPVDLPVPDSLQKTLTVLGATHIIAARTTLVYSPRTSTDRSWKCAAGWLPQGSYHTIPDPLPPRGIVLVATDGRTTGSVELESTRSGPWATSSGDPALVARWLQAGAMMDGLGADPDAETKVLARFGHGLALPAGD